MSINVIIHKQKVNNSCQTDFNGIQHFAEIDLNDLIQQFNEKKIMLDNMGSFFVQDIKSNKVFRVYFADFTKVYKIGGSPLAQEYTEDIFSVTISGTIEFK